VRIGVVSDTHNHLGNVATIVALLNRARVDRVVHTGDITQAKTLRALAALDAPLVGVFGNNDVERDALGAACAELGHHFVDPPLRLGWHGRRIVVVHDPRELECLELAEVDVALYGHDHRHALEHRAGTLHFNPGECAGHVPGYNRVGVLDLATLEAEVLRF